MSVYSFERGTLPLLVSIPHAGTDVPKIIGDCMTTVGRELPDTDWYVDQLYAFANRMGASVIKANYSRYVVDLNRSPDSAALYDSNPTSPVCAAMTFGGEAIYAPGKEPSSSEIIGRVQQYWRPYHEFLQEELDRMRAQHGFALLWDAHSILSEVPDLFTGVLPEFNIGTRNDVSCPAEVGMALLQSVESDGQYSAVLNGRFTGGYITMHYGLPANRVWAVQLELAQRIYMDETHRRSFDANRAQDAARLIETLMNQYLSLARQRLAE
jgi:N-formylglutamate deformylase